MTRLSPRSPNTRPGWRDTAPATRVSYAFADACTRFGSVGSTMTTVPGASGDAVSTHSATSWYFAPMLPSTVTSPATWSFVAGVVVPMPMLPLLATANFELLPSRKLMLPPAAMLLIRYSCVVLLNPWNCANAPFWS